MESIVLLEICRWLLEMRQVWSQRSGRGALSCHFRTLTHIREISLYTWSVSYSHTVHVGARSKVGILRKSLGTVGIGTVGVTIALGLKLVIRLPTSIELLSYLSKDTV